MDLKRIAAELVAATDELKAHNDFMAERDLLRSTDEHIARMREFRHAIRPFADSDLQPRMDNVGMVCANFVYRNGAMK